VAFFLVIERSHGVGGDEEQASPGEEFGPLVVIQDEGSGTGKQAGIFPEEYEHHEDAGAGGEHGVPAAIDVGGKDCGQGVEAENHAVRSDQPVEEAGDDEEGEDKPEFLVDFGEADFESGFGVGGIAGKFAAVAEEAFVDQR